jgi:uncharacterized protein
MTTRLSRVQVEIPKAGLEDLCRRYRVRRLALFGSVIGKDFRPDSDVDILVSFQPDAGVGFIALSRMQRELSELFQRPVDLVPLEGVKAVIRESILANIEEVYAA